MKADKTNRSSFSQAYNTTWQALKNNPNILLPFAIFAALEFLILIIFYLSPRMPFVLFLGPIVRTFWGEGFLHYPLNFLLLPTLDSLIRLILSVIIGSLLTGAAVAMCLDIYQKKHPKFKNSFKQALKSYISLFAVVLIATLVFLVFEKLINFGLKKYFFAGHAKLLFIPLRFWFGPILLVINLIMGVLIQGLFVYVIPILIIDKEKLFKALLKSFSFFKKFFISTIFLVGIPMLIYIPIIIVRQNSLFLMNKIFPEFILFATFIGILISSLVIDLLVTISTAFFYLLNKENVS